MDDDAQLASMFERGWTLYLSGEKQEALAVFERALEHAERAAGAPEGDRRLRVQPTPSMKAYAVGNRVLVPTPFLLLVAEPRAGRIERVVRGSPLQAPQVVRGTSLIIDRYGLAGTQVLDGETLAPIASWGGWALARPSPDGALLAVEVSVPGESNGGVLKQVVVFDTHERREITRFAVPELHDVRIVDEGRVLVNGGEVRDARSGRLLFTQSHELGSPAFAESYVAFAASDGAVVLAERGTWKPIARTRACAKATSLAFDSSSKILAIGGADSACLVDVPSLKTRRSFVARSLPIFQHPELEARLRNRTIPTFLGNPSVLALESSRTNEVSLFDVTTGRRLSHDVGELHVPEHSDAYVVTSPPPREVITIGATGTIARRSLAEGEPTNPSREDAPASDLLDRIRANLCILDWGMIDWGRGTPVKSGFWVVPREACGR